MPFNWGWDAGWTWGWIFPLAGALFWIALIIGAVLLLRDDAPRLRDRFSSPSALRILEERYAKGEISREEFFERRAILLREPAGAPSAPEEATPATDTGTEKLAMTAQPPDTPPPNTPPPEPPPGSTRE